MKRILVLIALIGSLAHSFEFDGWKSGMTMEEVISTAKLNNKVMVLTPIHINDKKFNKLRIKGYKKRNLLYTKDYIFKKDKTIRLYFTKTTKKLYKLTIQLNLRDRNQLKNFEKKLNQKYDEINNPDKTKARFGKLTKKIRIDRFWNMNSNDSYIHFKKSILSQNEISYIDKNLLKLNTTEKAANKDIIYKKDKSNDMEKF